MLKFQDNGSGGVQSDDWRFNVTPEPDGTFTVEDCVEDEFFTFPDMEAALRHCNGEWGDQVARAKRYIGTCQNCGFEWPS